MISFFSFVILSLIHLGGEALPHSLRKKWLRFLTKPLLMPLLALFYLSYSPEPSLLIILALAGGWLGDICLMLSDKRKLLFKLGLFSFLVGHGFYIATFFRAARSSDPYLHPLGWALIAFFALFALVVFLRLKPFMGTLFIPITLYAIVITLMGISTTLCLRSQPPSAALICIMGAIIFIISDTINGWYRFAKPVPHERLIVMSTYLMGQFLLILGYIKFI